MVAALGESVSNEIEAALGRPGHFLSDPIRVLSRNHEVELIEEQGRWQEVRHVKSGDIGWINRIATNPPTIDWSKMDQAHGCPECAYTADEVEVGGGRG